MKYIAVLFIICTCTFSHCNAMNSGKVIAITFSGEKQETITVHKGDTLLVKLPMASGTGFVWQVSGTPNFCSQGDTKYEHIKTNLPGSTLMEVLNFSITASGIENISFIYHQPFGNKAPSDTKILHLIVK